MLYLHVYCPKMNLQGKPRVDSISIFSLEFLILFYALKVSLSVLVVMVITIAAHRTKSLNVAETHQHKCK